MSTFEAMLASHQDETAVVLAGDWHGDIYWMVKSLDALAETGESKLILHVGDFGIWPGNSGRKFLYRTNKKLVKHDMDIVVTLGNHEDWGRLTKLWDNPKRQDKNGRPLPLQFEDRIWVLPRPYRFEVNNVKFLSLGGAASVDVDFRTEGRDWWPEETITREHVEKAVAGGETDVLITHETPDAPYCVSDVDLILRSNPFGFSERGLAMSRDTRRKVTQVLEETKPQLHVHGHMHVTGQKHFFLKDSPHRTTVLSLDESMNSGNIEILDLSIFS